MVDKPDVVADARAMQEAPLHSLDEETRSAVLMKIVAADREQKEAGQANVVWDGPLPEREMIGKDVVATTSVGDVPGRAVYFGKMKDWDGIFRRTVFVHVPASGSIIQTPGRNVRLAGDDDRERMHLEIAVAARIPAANAAGAEVVRARRNKRVGGSHLVERMLLVAQGKQVVIGENSGYHKFSGGTAKRVLYLAKVGGRVDLSGYDVDHPAVVKIFEEEAKAKHRGNVRGTFDFSRTDAELMAAWELSLDALVVAS